jgi:ribosomal-protein-alanine N-acetyltransferase
VTVWRVAPLHLADLDAVVTLEAESFRQPWSRSLLAGELALPEAYALGARPVTASANDHRAPLLGYILLRRIVDVLHIQRLAVAPPWRRRGLARHLLAGGLAAAPPDAATATLEVRSGNRAALALYRRAGFNAAGRRPRYYTDTAEDAVILSKPLKEAT